MKLFGLIEAITIHSLFFVRQVQLPHNHLFRHLERYPGTPSAGLDIIDDGNEIEICKGLSVRLTKQRLTSGNSSGTETARFMHLAEKAIMTR